MKKWMRWIPVIMIIAIICICSSVPNLTLYDARALSPEMMRFIHKYTYHIGGGGFFSYRISPHPDFIAHKLGHIFGFGSLGIALFYATGRSQQLALFLTGLFAASDELHQYFVAGRSSRFGDIVLDTLSAVLFVFVARKVERRIVLCARVEER